MNIFFEQGGDSFDLSVRKNVLWALLFGCVRIGSALHFASLSQNGLIFRVPKRSIHKVCAHSSAENQDSLAKRVEM